MLVLPGQVISSASSASSSGLGSGLFVRHSDGAVVASLSGILQSDPATGKLSVLPLRDERPFHTQVIPSIGQIIIGRVVKLNSKYAGVEIVGVVVPGDSNEHLPLMEPVKGTIRMQDILPPEELSTPPIQHLFRPGDVVRARVIGVGDPSAGLLLSTALAPELGVIHGKSAAAGAALVPCAWNEMLCTRTGLREKRKCAKPSDK